LPVQAGDATGEPSTYRRRQAVSRPLLGGRYSTGPLGAGSYLDHPSVAATLLQARRVHREIHPGGI
jgi:hypothetical protein